MKRSLIVMAACAAIATSIRVANAGSAPSVKLPYVKGQSFVVTQGYNTPPTHIKKDSYALDLTQNGCDAYGMPVVAAASGTVMFLSQEGYNGGYGTELILDHGNNIVSRYAHMIPGSIVTGAKGVAVAQGQVIGLLGDTGLVAGAACADHPGTHLHFAMDTVNGDGTFSAYDPEPISGYSGVTAGKWYLSDNGTTTMATTVSVATTVAVTTPTSSTNIVFSGGFSVAPAVITASPTSSSEAADDNTTSTSVIVDASSTATTTTTTTSSTTSTATSTATSTVTSTTPVVPQAGTLFEQTDNSANSPGSFYDENWFDLGNGFSGTLNTLTLRGMVSEADYFASHVVLEEYKEKDYTGLVQQFTISDNAPFTHTMATATFDGLTILLKPYFYYQLYTIQDYQNRSVILAGTTTTTVGVVMAHNFIYGVGGVEPTSTFFPFMTMEGIIATSTLTPPPLTTPTNLTATFDALGMQLNVSFSTSTDPDWPANPLGYQMNYSTSTTLSDSGWTAPGPIPLTIGNTYLIGIRAADNYGDVSAAVTTTWNFPAGFVPYLLSPKMNSATQYFRVSYPSTLSSIQLFTTDFETNTWYPTDDYCSLHLFAEFASSSYEIMESDNGFNGSDCAGAPVFSFASLSPMLYPDYTYHWVFGIQTASPQVGASVRFYGTATDTAGGPFSDPSLANAKFTVSGGIGTLFSN